MRAVPPRVVIQGLPVHSAATGRVGEADDGMSTQIPSAARMAVALLGLGLLGSCATLNEEECMTADWFELGRKDGAAGRPASYIDAHRRACEKHKLPVEQQPWQVGWDEGIRLYCTPDNGLLQGREGRGYANSCPPDLKTGFETAYHVAKRVYDARQSRDRLQSEISGIERQLRVEGDRDERRALRDRIDRLRDDLRTAERRLRDAERDYDRYVFARR